MQGTIQRLRTERGFGVIREAQGGRDGGRSVGCHPKEPQR